MTLFCLVEDSGIAVTFLILSYRRKTGNPEPSAIISQVHTAAQKQESPQAPSTERAEGSEFCYEETGAAFVQEAGSDSNAASSHTSAKKTGCSRGQLSRQSAAWTWLNYNSQAASEVTSKHTGSGTSTPSLHACQVASAEAPAAVEEPSPLTVVMGPVTQGRPHIHNLPEVCDYSVMVKGHQLGFISKQQLLHAHVSNPLTGLEGLQLVATIKRQAGRLFHPDKMSGLDDGLYKSRPVNKARLCARQCSKKLECILCSIERGSRTWTDVCPSSACTFNIFRYVTLLGVYPVL